MLYSCFSSFCKQYNMVQYCMLKTPKSCFKISFGGIPNSSSIDIPSLTTWAPFCAIVLPMWTMLSAWSKQSITWLLLSRLQGNKPHRNSPEPSEPCLRNLHQHAPELFGTLPPEPSEPCLRNLHQHAPELFGTLRNLPELASGTYHFTPELSGTLPEPASGTYTSRRRNSPELSGTFLRNLLLQPAPAHTGAYLG